MRALRRTVLVVVLCLAGTAAAAATGPAAVIERLHQALLETMRQAQTLGPKGRYETLFPVVVDSYDFPRMIAIIAGSAWATADAAERTAAQRAFERMSVATYASRFTGYDGERFEITGERPGARGTQLVETRLVRPKDPPVPITYVFAERDGQWRIIDVLLDNAISELATRRSEYAATLREGGLSRLASVLDGKADSLLAP